MATKKLLLLFLIVTLLAPSTYAQNKKWIKSSKIYSSLINPRKGVTMLLPGITRYEDDSIKIDFLVNSTVDYEYDVAVNSIHLILFNKGQEMVGIDWPNASLNNYPILIVEDKNAGSLAWFIDPKDVPTKFIDYILPQSVASRDISSTFYKMKHETFGTIARFLYDKEDDGEKNFELHIPIIRGNAMESRDFTLQIRRITDFEVDSLYKDIKYWWELGSRVRKGMTIDEFKNILGEPLFVDEGYRYVYPHIDIYIDQKFRVRKKGKKY